MKNKLISSIFALTFLLSLFSISFASADVTIGDIQITSIPTSVSPNQGSFPITFNITNNGSTAGDVVLTLTLTTGVGTTSITSPQTFAAGESKIISGTINFNAGQTGVIAGKLTADPIGSSPAVEKTFSVNIDKSFCRNGPAGGNLSIDRVKISSSGDDDDEWELLDTVEIEVKVANEGVNDIRDVFVEIGLFDSQGRNQISDLEFENTDEEKIDAGRIRDGDDTIVTFNFKVPADFEEGDYKLAVKAFSDDLGESRECTDSFDNAVFQNIDVIRENDEGKFIAFDNIVVDPDQATCGDTVTVTTDVVNVGDEDQDQVKVNLYSTELGITPLENIIRDDLDQGDKKQVTFTFGVPNNLQDKLYRLQFNANYDYRNGIYRESSDDPTEFTLRVLGCSSVPETGEIASINAALASEAQAGKPLVVRATITSRLSTESDFVIRPTGYESWATLSSISDRIIHLGVGQSKDITLNFNVNNDATGEQSFALEAIANGKTESQDISVNIAPASTGTGFNLGNNGLIWIIGIINVVLIILIIVVAIRISRR